MNNEFIIKINKDSKGNKLSLDNINIEAASALKIFIESLTELAKQYKDVSDIKLSLKSGSIESCFVYPKSGNTIEDDLTSIINGTSENNERIKLLKEIQNKIKANGLDYSVYHKVGRQKIDVTSKFKSKDFSLKRSSRLEFNEKVVFLSGKLFESGGKVKTNVHIESGVEEYTVECSREQAVELNRRLYDQIQVAVVKKWKPEKKPTYHLLDSYLKEEDYIRYKTFYESIESNRNMSRFDSIHNKIVEIINSEKIDNGEILKIMKLYDYSQSDRGVLRTILMTLKPVFKNESKITDKYIALAKLLRDGSVNNKI
jgi:hypothetical protein